jgi:hypothetical protein
MKYTKKFMVVPFEEETETELLQKNERKEDKKLTDILNSNDYHKYNQTFKKSLYNKTDKQNDKKEKNFETELNNITNIINDILENKKVNDDNYYKPIFTQTRSKKTKKSPIKKKTPTKIEKKTKSKKLNVSKESIENTLNTGLSEILDPERYNQLENVLKNQIKNEQENLMTEDTDSDDINKSIRKKILQSLPSAPKKVQKTRESLNKNRIDITKNNQTKWDHLT